MLVHSGNYKIYYSRFRMVQDQSFANEKRHLLGDKIVPRKSSIVKLDPSLDDKGIIRVAVILPKKCNISKMVVDGAIGVFDMEQEA